MSREAFLLKLAAAVLLSVVFAVGVYHGNKRDSSEKSLANRRYIPYMAAYVLPVYMAVSYTLRLFAIGWERAADYMLAAYFGAFLHLCVYYLCLLLLIPQLRKKISARACAALWLLPNYLYVFCESPGLTPKPLFVLRIPGTIFGFLGAVWTIGFISVLLWKIISHYRFRHLILKDSAPITDPDVLELWNYELQEAGLKNTSYQLVRSPAVSTPLSIGFIEESTCIVLPERQYTPEELTLIFRHEIVHISRLDSMTKFFLVFCTAVCWFNPLMWVSMRRSADDLELSCDETVLLRSDEGTRKRYAELLLRTAGDERGFTTCLSASAESLRYRLKNVLAPRKRTAGGLIVAVVFFTLVMSFGYVSLAYREAPGREAIFCGEDDSQFSVSSIAWNGRNSAGDYAELTCADESALYTYLSKLALSQLINTPSNYRVEEELTIDYRGPDGIFYVDLSDHLLRVVRVGKTIEREVYYIAEEIDWDYVSSLLLPAS